MTSAKTAMRRIASMMAAPAAPRGFLRQKRTRAGKIPSRLARARAAPESLTSTVAGSATIAHARIEDAVQHVHGEVGQDDDDGNEHDQVLHDGVVAPRDGLDEKARHSGEIEHGLRDH